MTDRHTLMQRIEQTGVIAVIRADDAEQAVHTCDALARGGVIACEVAMTTPGALRAIEQAAERFAGRCIVGVGTVLDPETARAAILAGAAFIFCPILDPRIIEMGHRYDIPVVPGAMTPTEILAAWSAGADMVKIFPANHFGPTYIKDIHGPLPQVKLTPTGGVDLTTAGDWIKAGAAALGVGSSLVKKDLIRAGRWADLSSLAGQYIAAVAAAR